MSFIPLTQPDGQTLWVRESAIEMICPAREVEHGLARTVIVMGCGQRQAVIETIEEIQDKLKA